MGGAVTTAAAARAAVRAMKREGAEFVKIQSGLSRECLRAVAGRTKRQRCPSPDTSRSLSAFEVIAASPASLEHLSPVAARRRGLMRACSPMSRDA